MQAAFELFGESGEAAVTVRSVCRHAALNSRYFYESFTDTDHLLGAVYDDVVTELGGVLLDATVGIVDDRARLRAGIRAVLQFSSADPRRGKILFTEATTNPVLSVRRVAAQDQLRRLVLTDRRRTEPDSDPVAIEVAAAIYAGAMAELARQWLSGALGDDLDSVVEPTVRLLMPAVAARRTR